MEGSLIITKLHVKHQINRVLQVQCFTHTHTDGHVSIILLRNELRWDNKDIVVSNYYGGCEGVKKGKQILCLPESS